ncbi:MAG TPA: matrixin family metalloprotease [Gemmatimonadaceae bacterium]|jgi:predicted Zn-dependent protease
MKSAQRASFTALYLVIGVAALGAVKQTSSPEVAVVHALAGSREQSAAGSVGRALFLPATNDVDEPDRAAVRRRLRRDEQGTYIGEILQERDSSLARWPDRGDRPLTVWIQPTAGIENWVPGYVDRVREAFDEWQEVGLPLGFVFVDDSADAEVHVNWIDHFSEPISGRTKWARDDEWLITDANIILAVHHHQGEVLDEEAMRAMALHEIGHLLGLDHTQDATSIMAPKVRVRDLSAADRATVRLLYSLPPGPVR